MNHNDNAQYAITVQTDEDSIYYESTMIKRVSA